MFTLRQWCSTVAVLAVATPIYAQVAVKDPWVRATVPQQRATGAFMQLVAPADTRLVEARSPAADIVEVHEMAMDGNVMKMRAIAGLDLPAGRTVELKPGGYHVMLIDLKRPISVGDKIPLTLVFEGKDKKRETLEVSATARALGATADKGHHKH
jgi:periplasmic copper chaperone A